MTDGPDLKDEIVDEMEEANAGRPGGSRLTWLVVGVMVGAGLLVGVLRNPFGLAVFEPAAAWLSGGRTAAPPSSEADDGQLWTCGMHPNVVQDEPGICPICQMDLTPMAMEGESAPSHDGHDHGGIVGDIYSCPMHAQIMQGEPGSCPICGMDLVKVDAHAAGPPAEAAPEALAELWTCPMHPQVIQDEPGACPICGMDLVRMETDASGAQTAPATQPSGERELLFYRNPMNPDVTSPVPMKDEMGMDYVPVYSEESDSAGSEGAVVTLDAGTVQNMNVVTASVRRGDLVRRVRTVGYLDYDEESMVSVTTKYEGFVEKVHANYLGQSIREGEALFDVYSPALVQTQEELITALDFARSLEGAPAEARERAQLLVDAARRRLGYWDISPRQISRIEASGTPLRTLTVTATAGGLVMKRMPGLEGMAIKPGMQLLHLADISSLWLDVEIYEDQLGWLALDDPATMTFPYFPGESFTGRVRYIEPEVQAKTRTVRVTLEIPNRDRRLRAGMYADVAFEPVTRRDVVLVPSQALLRTGERDLVVIEQGKGKFAPREVRLGAAGDEEVEILAGLEPGEQIVVSSQFLIDSESSLREAILKMIADRKAN